MHTGKQKLQKKILLDASSAILFAKADFHIIVALNYSVLMSESVFAEITRKRLPGSREYEKLEYEELLIVLPRQESAPIKDVDIALHKLDHGEYDTIRLFFAGHGDFVVTDDGAAAKYCLNKNIPFVNSLLMLRILFQSGKIENSTYKTGFRKILSLGRYSEKIIRYARSCPEQELSFFLPGA